MNTGSPEALISVAQQALWVLMLASAPLLLPALLVGLLLGIVQAATSINEATLSFVPKLLAVALCLLLFGSMMMGLMVDFAADMFERIAMVTR